LQRRSFSELQSAVFQNDSFCNVVYIPPPSIPPRGCVVKELYFSTCNASGRWISFDSKILNACHSDLVDVFLDCSLPFERILFKNIFCAMCNIPDWINHLTTECVSSINLFDWRAENIVSFAALIDLGANDEVELSEKWTECSANSLYESHVVSWNKNLLLVIFGILNVLVASNYCHLLQMGLTAVIQRKFHFVTTHFFGVKTIFTFAASNIRCR
jgi:hypothetical protein